MREEKTERLCIEILQNCRNQLYHLFPYLDGAFASLKYHLESEEKLIRTDGESLFFSGRYLINAYIKNPNRITRGYLHMLLHCLFLHPWPEQQVEPDIWNLACDLMVESMISREGKEELEEGCSEQGKEALQPFLHNNYSTMEIYRKLKSEGIHTDFVGDIAYDDHSKWYEPEMQNKGKDMVRKWEHIRSYSGANQSKQNKAGTQKGNKKEEFEELTKSRYDYSRFLKQFSVLREEVELDTESFDYIFYHLGMETYGNMPLIEPLEYKEVNRLEELVIAIDTSSSCTTEIVQQFLAETYQMLSQKENFFRKMNVHLVQCDTHIEDAVVIHSEEEWIEYSKHILIQGRGGTDFRPVFKYVKEMQDKKEIRNLKALLYFTDGDGIFPTEKTSYTTAFVFLKEKAKTDQVPEWAHILMI